jgi:hypothetical protein
LVEFGPKGGSVKMTSSIFVLALIAASVCQVALGGVAHADDKEALSSRGVTSDSIKLGITYPNIACGRNGVHPTGR